MTRLYTTGFKENGVDLGDLLVEKSYLIDVYPQLVNWSKTSSLWGLGAANYSGVLGDNTSTSKSSPVQTIAGGTNWKSVSSNDNAAAAIKTDGTLWVWGYNYSGGLGDGTVVNKSSPVQTVAGGTDWKQVSVGNITMLSIKADGTLWTWGYNYKGQLGTGNMVSVSSPVQTIAGGTDWKQVSTRNFISAAIKNDGTLWTWGSNTSGQLGDNTRVHKSSPVQTVAGGTNWKQVSASNVMAAIKTDGTLWLWGQNIVGQIGDNTQSDKSSPVQTVAGGTNWKQVSASGDHLAAIKTDGTLWTWGYNTTGELGDNTVTSRSSPVQTIAGGTNWKSVTALNNKVSAIKTDGTLWVWGSNYNGILGIGSETPRSSPVQTIAGGTNWKLINGVFAIKEDGDF